ncbi:MAG: hypothetical protein K8S00_01665, partial [Bacteroidales bacterium]|nr:hypothetical protein [Bacteroidales bacterium]
MKTLISSKSRFRSLAIVMVLCMTLSNHVILHAQDTIHTTAGSVLACPGEIVTIPVNVTNCNDVASISLKLGYDPTVLIYQGWQNLHPALSSGMLLVNSSGTSVALSWFHLFQSANVGTDTLIEYMFTYLGGTSSLIWDTATHSNCIYGKLNADTIPALFFDGSISLLGPSPQIISHPSNTTIFVNANASFSVTALYATNYQWEESTDNGLTWNVLTNSSIYSGTTTGTLSLINVPLGMNGYKYRCHITGICPTFPYSSVA